MAKTSRIATRGTQAELAGQPRDASPERLGNRDATGDRPRSHLRKFGLPGMHRSDL